MKLTILGAENLKEELEYNIENSTSLLKEKSLEIMETLNNGLVYNEYEEIDIDILYFSEYVHLLNALETINIPYAVEDAGETLIIEM